MFAPIYRGLKTEPVADVGGGEGDFRYALVFKIIFVLSAKVR